MRKLLAILISMTALIACEESIKDGIIPEKYREQAKQYEGRFRGEFEGRQMTLTFKVDDAGRALLSVRDENGKPELIANCSSKINELVAVDAKSSDNTLRSARFAFDGWLCGLVGDTLTVEIKNPNHLVLAVPESESMEHGPDDCTYHPIAGPICTPGPAWPVVDSWLTGTFTRE